MLGSHQDAGPVPPAAVRPGGYAIGDAGRAAVEVGAGLLAGPPCWPDCALDTSQVPGAQVRAASVRGIVHRLYGTPRQDSYSVVWQEDSQALVVTVCDGVGAYDLSHEAAELAARRMAHELRCDPGTGEPGWAAAFAAVSAQIDALAEARGAPMATTVVSAYVTPLDGHGYRAAIAWVGDSAAYLLDASGWHIVAGTVKSAAAEDVPLSSATAALPCASIDVQACAVDVGADAALFLMTDGIADPLGGGAGEVGAALAAWWSLPPDIFEFAAQAAFARRSFDDDRTVVGLWPLVIGGRR